MKSCNLRDVKIYVIFNSMSGDTMKEDMGLSLGGNLLA